MAYYDSKKNISRDQCDANGGVVAPKLSIRVAHITPGGAMQAPAKSCIEYAAMSVRGNRRVGRCNTRQQYDMHC